MITVRVLRSNAGASLIFVLASMLLLMAIGVSAITAAALNHGAVLVQRDRNQLNLYISSMERTMRAALLETEPGATLDIANTFTGRFLREAYMSNGMIGQWQITAQAPGGGVRYDMVFAVRVDTGGMPDINVFIDPYIYIPEQYDIDEDGNAFLVSPAFRKPESATIDATMTVTQNVFYDNETSPVSVTMTTYRFSGGRIDEQDYGVNPGQAGLEYMHITGWGTWTVERHETLNR